MRQLVLAQASFGPLYAFQNDLITGQILKFGGHTRPELAMLLSVIAPGDFVFDLGAHIGTFAIPIAQKVGAGGKVLAVEGLPRTFKVLRKNLRLNAVESVVEPMNALIAPPGQAYSPVRKQKNSGGTRFAPASEPTRLSVPFTSIDELASRHFTPRVIKIDIEGFEAFALTNSEVVRRSLPIVYGEISAQSLGRNGAAISDLDALFRGCGYRLYRNAGPRNANNDHFQIEVFLSCRRVAISSTYWPFTKPTNACQTDRDLQQVYASATVPRCTEGAPLSEAIIAPSRESKSRDTAFIGHPVGLGWLSASEFWERFCYYGMQSLLVLYLTHYLLQPGHIEQVWGFAPFQRLIGWLYPKATQMALASNTAQLYAALVYITPLGGGLVADRLIGRTATVSIGATVMVIGTLLLAFNSTFLIALALLLLGIGCFKGNIASQVGDLYRIDDPRRADGFQIYFMGIQLAVIFSPVICGYLGQRVDWHLGFVAAGVGMVIGLATYLAGRRNFPPEPIRKKADHVERPPLTPRDWKVVILLVALLPVLAVSITANQQIQDAYLVWGEKTFQTVFFGFNMPITWLVSIDAFVSAVTMIGVIAFWRWYGRHWKEPDEITKIVIGVAISATGPLVLAGCSVVADSTHHPVPLFWAIGFHILNDIGFANVLPVGLALYSRAAPKGTGGTMIAVYYVHLFMGNLLTGYLGGLLGTMPNSSFWLMHAGLMAVSAVILLGASFVFSSLLAPKAAEA